MPVHVVARFLGHDPAITQRTYAHVTATALDAASGVFDQVLGRVPLRVSGDRL